MPSFEWNKIIASVLTAVIVAMVAGLLSQELFQREIPSKPVFMVEGAQQAPTAAAAQPAAPTLEPIGPLLAKADIKKGQELTTVCAVCHTFDKGGPNKIGPNLWGVAGGPVAEDRGGFAFSAALDKHHGQKWTPQLLNEWLHDPQHFAQGTKMTFAGFPKAKDRADVIAYLETLTPGGVAGEQALAKKLAAEAAQQKPAAAKPAPAAPTAPTITALLAKADAKKGKELTQICSVCHTFDKGGENKIGPNLWNVVGEPIAQDRNNYPFSTALEKHKGQKWTPQLLNEWLDNPQHFAQGTKMTFAGFPKAQNRADVIKYLETLK